MTSPALTAQDIDEELQQDAQTKSDVKSTTRTKIDKMRADLTTGQGPLPKVVGGVMMVPAMLSKIKTKEVPVKTINL
jgi:hypothetical protein